MARPRKIYYGEDHWHFRPALERFAEKCRFDPTTGCVLWTGGTSAGHGNTARYGRFKDAGVSWSAHRWAAIHIHGLDLGDGQAGHVCPHGPNTLCVQHLEAQSQTENLRELHERLKACALQSAEAKQHWLFIAIGIREPEPPREVDPDLIPFYLSPAWMKPFQPEPANDCPF